MVKPKQHMCRFCLSLIDLYPLFPFMQQSKSYKRALYLITGLKIDPSDGLPQKICRKCAEIVEDGMTFRKKCREVESKLLKENKSNVKSRSIDTVISLLIDKESKKSQNAKVNDKKFEKPLPSQIGKKSEEVQNYEMPVQTLSYETYSSERGKDDWPKIDEKVKAENDTINDDRSGDDSDHTKDSEGEMGESQKLNKNHRPKLTSKDYLELLEDPKNNDLKKCKLCKKTFKSMSGFCNHTRFHFGFGIICEFCGFRCLAKPTLMRHLRALHGAERDDKYPCSFCDYRALDNEQLVAHERREHTHERPHVCAVCGDGFYTKKVLVQHLLKHKPEKPFQCDKCPSKFKTLAWLNLHTRTSHEKIKTHLNGCYLCSKQYVKTTSARKHILKIHGIPNDQQDKLVRIKCK